MTKRYLYFDNKSLFFLQVYLSLARNNTAPSVIPCDCCCFKATP